MDAKTELINSIALLFPDHDKLAQLKELFASYTVSKESEAGRYNLSRRINIFLAAKKIDGLSLRTLENYRYILSLFQNRVNKHVSKINSDDIREYIVYLGQHRQLQESSLQTHVNTLRSFFAWCLSEGVIRTNPMNKIKSAKIDQHKRRHALSSEELERLRDACKNYKEHSLVEFLVSTGCRLTELIGIKLDDVNWRDRSVVVHGKGNKDRTVYFSVRTKLMLEEYLRSRKGNGTALFASSRAPYSAMGARAVQKALQKIGERAQENRRVHPHLMRHTFATSALNSGMDITVIQRLLGHNDLKTTQIYAELSQTTVKYHYERLIA